MCTRTAHPSGAICKRTKLDLVAHIDRGSMEADDDDRFLGFSRFITPTSS